MTQAKLTSDKGEILFAEVDSDGDYFVSVLDSYIIAKSIERGDYPGWSVEKVIELPTKTGAVVAKDGWNPYVYAYGKWYEVQGAGEFVVTTADDVTHMIDAWGFKIVFEGVEA